MINVSNATMESSILHELAAFDVRAPIDFSISFEDSNEAKEVTVKAEKVTDEDNTNIQDTNDLLQICLSPRNKIKEELTETTEEHLNNNELNSDQHFEQNVSKEITTLQTEILKNNTTNNDDERKRKHTLSEIHENKRGKKESTQENIPNNLSSHEKETEPFILNSTLGHQELDISHLDPINMTSTDALLSTNERERKIIKSIILSHLAKVAENMRLVMEAFVYHKLYNTPYDSYRIQKMNYFNASYNAVLRLILPQEGNREFIVSFLKRTYEHALQKPGLNRCCLNEYEILLKELLNWAKDKQKYQTTSKQGNTVQPTLNQTSSNQENTLQPTLNQTSSNQENTLQPTVNQISSNQDNTIQPTLNQTTNNPRYTEQPTLTGQSSCKGVVLENTRNQTEDNGFKNRKTADTICIFSAGSPGNEISINIDPNLNKCILTTNHFANQRNEASVVQTPKKSSVNVPQTEMPLQTHLGTQANEKNKHLQELLQRPPVIQSRTWFPNSPSSLYPEMYNYMQTVSPPVKGIPTKHDIPTNHKKKRPPKQKAKEIQNGLTTPVQARRLQPQSMPSPRMLPQTQQSVNTDPWQSTHAPSLYAQSTRPPPPPYDPSIWSQPWQQQGQLQGAKCQHIHSHYVPLKAIQQFGLPQHHILPQSNDQYRQQYLKDQSGHLQNMQPQYDQFQQIQNKKGQSQNMPPQYGQFQQFQSKIEQSQNMQRQYEQFSQVQNKIGQLQYIQPQCGQYQRVQNKMGQLQNMQPQYGQVPTQQSQQFILTPHVPQHLSPQIGQPSPVSPDCENRLQSGEWRQGLNELYQHLDQTQQLHKNAPRSTSTDSGIASPLNFNTSSDQTAPLVPDETEPPRILITHVTSLNPKVPFMDEGNCVICNKATKKVCMGCMKVYYCTYECQVQDWATHEPNCSNQAHNDNVDENDKN